MYDFKKKPPLEKTPREHFASNRDKAYQLFLHYSTVRLAIIAFVIPVGFRVITADDQTAAGVFLIGAAIVLNWIFAAQALQQALIYASLREFLRQKGESELKEVEYSGCFRFRECAARNYLTVLAFWSKSQQKEAVSGWATIEPLIQFSLIAGVFVFLCLIGEPGALHFLAW